MRWITLLLLVTIASSSLACQHKKARIQFPNRNTPVHYDFAKGELTFLCLGNSLCRIDNGLIFLHRSSQRQDLEYVMVNSLEGLVDENSYGIFYSLYSIFRLHDNVTKLYVCDQNLFHTTLSSWLPPDSTLLDKWPPSTAVVLGVRAGSKDGTLVYTYPDTNIITIGNITGDRYTECDFRYNFTIINKYCYYNKYCKIMELDNYTCIWFPSSQTFIFKSLNNNLHVCSLSSMLNSSPYRNSIIVDAGLICNDNKYLYICIYTPETEYQYNSIVDEMSGSRMNATAIIVQFSLDGDGKYITSRFIGQIPDVSTEMAMECFDKMLLVLNPSRSLDTLPINSYSQ